jgi:FKBP-type peptidyl-prolyl cis-trans isomerase FkpA
MKITHVFVGLLMVCVACSSSEKETPSGLKFNLMSQGDGVLPKPGQISVFDFVFIDSKDSVWGNTYEQGMPAAVMINDSTAIATEDGLMQMIRMISKGDSVTVDITMKDFFKDFVRAPIPPHIDSTLTLTYRIKIRDIMDQEAYSTYQDELMTKLREEQFAKDVEKIDSYLAEKGIQAEKLESGIRYVITKPGVGENAQSGQTVKVNYSGYLLDGQYFDSCVKAVAEEKGIFNPNRPYEPYPVTIDQTSVIKGWHESLKLLSKGAQGTFYIPSTLAYGPQRRSEVIKENSILVFDLEMVEITPNKVK